MKTCQWTYFPDVHSCGKPARQTARMPSGRTLDLCVEHYDGMMSFWKHRLAFPVYPADPERYRKALRLNQEPVQ